MLEKNCLIDWFTVVDQRIMRSLTLYPRFLFLITWGCEVLILWGFCLFCSTGLPGEEERMALSHFQPKNSENWDVQILNNPSSRVPIMDVIKQEVSQSGNLYGSLSSNNNMLDFTYNNKADHRNNVQLPDQTSEVRSPDMSLLILIYFFFSSKLSTSNSVCVCA